MQVCEYLDCKRHNTAMQQSHAHVDRIITAYIPTRCDLLCVTL